MTREEKKMPLVSNGLGTTVPDRREGLAPGCDGIRARARACGCVPCICSDPDRCHGCGAKHCGTHPVGEIPNPVHVAEPAPGDEITVALVDAVVRAAIVGSEEELRSARGALLGWIGGVPGPFRPGAMKPEWEGDPEHVQTVNATDRQIDGFNLAEGPREWIVYFTDRKTGACAQMFAVMRPYPEVRAAVAETTTRKRSAWVPYDQIVYDVECPGEEYVCIDDELAERVAETERDLAEQTSLRAAAESREAEVRAALRDLWHDPAWGDNALAFNPETMSRCRELARAPHAGRATGEDALGFDDALRIARGCTDYGGGYRGDPEKFEVYQHGIQTVINALSAARERGLADTQVAALHHMGAKENE